MSKIDGKRVKELLNALDNVSGWSAGQGAMLAQRPNVRLPLCSPCPPALELIVDLQGMLSAIVNNKTIKCKDAQKIYSTYKLLLLAASSFRNPVAWYLGLGGIFGTAMEGVKMMRDLQMSLAQIILYARTDMGIMLFMSDQQTVCLLIIFPCLTLCLQMTDLQVLGKFGSLKDVQTDFHATMATAQKHFRARADCTQPIELTRLTFPLRKPGCEHNQLAISARFGHCSFSLEVLDAKSMGIPLDLMTCATGPCLWNYA